MLDYTDYFDSASLSKMTTSSLIISVVSIIAMWKIFTKANRPGWYALIPIFNFYELIDIAGLEWYYLLLLIIPFVNVYAIFKIYIELAHKFGKSSLFGVLCVFFSFICMLILAFDSSTYEEDIMNNTVTNNYTNPVNNNPQNFSQANGNNISNLGSTIATNPSVENPTTMVNPIPMPNTTSNEVPNPTQIPNTPETINPNPTPVNNTKYCTHCGSQVDANSTICPKCGTYLG